MDSRDIIQALKTLTTQNDSHKITREADIGGFAVLGKYKFSEVFLEKSDGEYY